jgi:hypothetical protein
MRWGRPLVAPLISQLKYTKQMEKGGGAGAIASSVARLGGFPPNWATFDFISRGKNALGGYIHFGLLLPISGGFLIM